MTEELLTLSQKLEKLEAELSSLKNSESSRYESEAKVAFDSLMIEAQSLDPKLSQMPTLTIGMRPKSTQSLPRLFSGSDSPIVKLLEEGIEERSGGFGLGRAYQGSRIVRGQYRVVISPGHDLRLVSREGTCVFVVAANNSFLSWAMRETETQTNINPIAISEYVYSIAVFMTKLADAGDLSKSGWKAISEWKNIESAGRKLTMPTGRLNTLSFALGGHNVEEAEVRMPQEVSLNQEPAALGYQLLKMIYNGAGVDDAHIPYVVRGQETIDLAGLYASR